MQVIIFPSLGSNPGSLACQANALTTVLLSLLHYPLYVGIIYLILLQKIALYIGRVVSYNPYKPCTPYLYRTNTNSLRTSEDTCFLLDTKV